MLVDTRLVGNDWKIAGTGHFNGDSKSDILWRNDNATVAIWNMNGNDVLLSSNHLDDKLAIFIAVVVVWKIVKQIKLIIT